MRGIKVSGVGKAVPKKSLTNNELCQMVDSSDDWITSRTGIKKRHIAEEETMTQLAIDAAKEALDESGLDKDKIDLVIVATVSPDYTMPSTACEVARNLDIKKAICFDITAACSGFIYGTQLAYSMIQTQVVQNALVIGAETLSKALNYNDRTTCVLFGDGAGAVVYEGTDQNDLLAISIGSKPEGSHMITLPTIAFDHTFSKKEEKDAYIHMQGKEVYCFATTKVPESIQEVVAKAKVALEDVDWFVLHQANSRIIDSVAKRLHIEGGKFFNGNTSAASIPMAIYDLKPQLKQGNQIILSGFGAGLTWGTMLLRWSK